MAVRVSLGRPHTSSLCFIFSLSMESNALEKSTNKSVASSFFLFFCLFFFFCFLFFARISIIRWIVRICDVMNRFLGKTF